MENRELDIVRHIRRNVISDVRTLVGIGDDAAVIDPAYAPTLVTTDMLLEGVHFDLSKCSVREAGRKAMAVNLSDIAAMAGEPMFATAAVGLPANSPALFTDELWRGMAGLANEFGVGIIGGDTNRSVSGLVICITLMGRTLPPGPVLRCGAKPGDAICVTGEVGGSILGRHLSFVPRVKEAQQLHQLCTLHSMIDLSDGLGSDLFHILDESGVGAQIDADSIPISQAARVLAAQDGMPPLDHALDDGEDFELLFTLPTEQAAKICVEQPLAQTHNVRIRCVGEITKSKEVVLKTAESERELLRRGFEHRM